MCWFLSAGSTALGRRNFTLRYDTNIPRQVGLAGSSAIVTAALRCLMDFYGVTAADVPRHRLPQLVLDVERQELGIQAGLQDRVVQVTLPASSLSRPGPQERFGRG